MQRIHLILASCLFWTGTLAQQFPFVHYTPREGLANNRARFLFQDSKGKLYVSTFGGLSIYDGSRFINYNTNNGLAAGLVNDIVEMGKDSIWILQNANKIHCLVNGKLTEFVTEDNYVPIINQLIKCSNGYYYAMADEGLFRLEGRRFKKIELSGLPNKNATAGLLDGVELDKKLYILSNPGFLSPYAENLIVYDLKQNKVLAHNDIKATSIFNTGANGIWILTLDGIFRIDGKEIKNKTILLKPIPDSCHIPKGLAALYAYRDRQNNTWLATPKGIYWIKRGGEIIRFTVESGLTTNSQNSIFQDYENNMWFTNEQTGLTKLSNQQLVFYPEIKPGFNTTDIFIRPLSDTVWLYDGFHPRVLMKPPGKQFEEYLYKGPVPGPIEFVSGNKEYMLGATTIFRWTADPKSKHFNLSIYRADSSHDWGYQFGMVDKNENLVTVSSKLEILSGSKALSAPLHYFSDQATVDKQGKIWVATRGNRLLCYEISNSGTNNAQLSLLKTYAKELPLMSPRSIAADSSGNIWIGARDHGLVCLHFDGLVLRWIKQLTTRNGLSDNFVNYLYCDKENNIWACTPSGLDRIRNVNNNFFVENITQRNNLYFPISKVQQTDNGILWILSTAGIITYNPVRPTLTNWKPQLEFTETVISNVQNKALKPGGKLPHFQNNLSFQLSSPTFIDEKQTRFSYLLEGSGNEAWSVPSTNASIHFVNLPPGEYTLRAKAIYLHGWYPDAESSFSFTILPPWWQTWWFKISAALLILALVIFGLRYYIKRRLELQRMILEKKQAIERERTRIATDMHDDLG
ncbi:MAG TPA: two-component regulator propeller domain-containing protein, partial [Chitinophagaceae bacterium]|nr:two-component regulator propeller domain-containing protein [Chitinophagaceae bacterium]